MVFSTFLPRNFTLCISVSVAVTIELVSCAFSFYMPHGLTVDGHGHFWMTDVAMHQVIKPQFMDCC